MNVELLTRSSEQPIGFSTVLADPPWPERGGGKSKRGADRHYELMNCADIISLPVATVCASNAHLWMWVTNNYLPQGLRAMEAWGFRYVTNVAWGKVKDGKVQLGLGQYTRGSHELLLFGVRGKLPSAAPQGTPALQISTLQLHERGRHSAKPEAIYGMVETISPPARLELFARGVRPGWFSVGSEEVESESYLRADVGDAINELAHNRQWLASLTRK